MGPLNGISDTAIQAEAANRAADLQMEQYQQSRQDMLPWYGAGESALYKLAALQGVDIPYAQGQGGYYDELQSIDSKIYDAQQNLQGQDLQNELARLNERKQFLQSKITPVGAGGQDAAYKLFQSSPDYQFALGEGLKATDLAMNKRGLLGSGRASKERMRYASGLASQKLQDYRNSLAALSGTGQTASSNIGQFGANAASAAGRGMMESGAARASGYQAKGAGYANMANAMSSGFGDAAGLMYLAGKGPFA